MTNVRSPRDGIDKTAVGADEFIATQNDHSSWKALNSGPAATKARILAHKATGGRSTQLEMAAQKGVQQAKRAARPVTVRAKALKRAATRAPGWRGAMARGLVGAGQAAANIAQHATSPGHMAYSGLGALT